MKTLSRIFKCAGAISLCAAQTLGQEIGLETAFTRCTDESAWTLVESVPLQFDTFHPQGMTRVGDRLFLSSVEVIDRGAGLGKGHVFEFTREGELVQSLALVDGAIYHPGGIDFDGEWIWLSLAEYRPDSSSIVYIIDPNTFEAREVFRFDDHLGAVAHLKEHSLLVGVSWGSRRVYEWEMRLVDGFPTPVDGARPRVSDNASDHAYQDLQSIPQSGLLFASGLGRSGRPSRDAGPGLAGGIDLLRVPGARIQHSLPVAIRTGSGLPITQNPVEIVLAEDHLNLLAIPEDHPSTLYMYKTE